MYPTALLRIAKKHDGILSNGRQRRSYGRTMPAAQSGGRIEFPHQAGFTDYCIQQPHIASMRNRRFEDSTCDPPWRTTKQPGAVQVHGAYPYFRKAQRTAKPGVRGCFLRAKAANPSPTAARSPLSRKRARAMVN